MKILSSNKLTISLCLLALLQGSFILYLVLIKGIEDKSISVVAGAKSSVAEGRRKSITQIEAPIEVEVTPALDSLHQTQNGIEDSPLIHSVPDFEQIEIERETAVRAHDTLNFALARGRWTVEDSLDAYLQISSLSDEVRSELRNRFHTAVNNQELELTDFPPY